MLIFGLKRDEVTEEWRELHSEELNDRYCYWVTGEWGRTA